MKAVVCSGFFFLCLVALAVFSGANCSSAQGAIYPEKPIVVIVPFPAGGRTDMIARLIAHELTKFLNEPVLVEDKPGADTVLGSMEVAHSKPDGYTLGFFSSAIVTSQYTAATPTSLANYSVISIVNIDSAALAVRASAPWKTLKDFVDYARHHPGKLRISTIPGAGDQILASGFLRAAGIKMIQVPFKGNAPAVIALAGGNVDATVSVPASFKNLVDAKKLRILAIAANSPSSSFSNIPTFRDNGINLELTAFNGFFAPKGTPQVIITKLADASQKAMSNSDVIKTMKNLDAGVAFLSGPEAKEFLKKQDATYKDIIDALGLRVAPTH